MRSVIKTVAVQTVHVVYYDSKQKQEFFIDTEVSEINPAVDIPDGCVEISREVTSEKEVKYKLTPEDFFKHATIIE